MLQLVYHKKKEEEDICIIIISFIMPFYVSTFHYSLIRMNIFDVYTCLYFWFNMLSSA
jgi:hypothetical protein